jgi:hypothetical protein
VDDLSTATKTEEYFMKFDTSSADAFGQMDVVVSNASLPHVTSLALRHKDGPAAGRSAVKLTFAVGFLVAAAGAWAADGPVRPQPIAELADTDSVRGQPTARQFAPQPDRSASDAIYVDELYRQLIGPPPATPAGFSLPDPLSGSTKG